MCQNVCMDLCEYLSINGLTQEKFAAMLGLKSRYYINRILNGRVTPSVSLAKKIQIATKGAVKAHELILPPEMYGL